MRRSVRDQEIADTLLKARDRGRKTIEIEGRHVEITQPYPSPEDWRDRWIYFLIVDRFDNPKAPPRAAWDRPFGGFQGGTFDGIRRRLGYLRDLGVGALWLTPVLQNCQSQEGSYHGYGIQNFLKVDPRLATDRSDPEGELRRLVDEAHAYGMHVIFDIVLNHAGDVFAYVRDDGTIASALDWRESGYPIRWRDARGNPVADWSEAPGDNDPRLMPEAAVWPSELRRNEIFRRKGKGGEAGGDFESLREFVSAEPEVRNALITCYQWVIARFDVDGFRIDTLKYIEPDFARIFGNAMREFALEIGKKNFFTFGEVYDDEFKIAAFIGRHASESGDLVGVDAALDFPLFFRLPAVAKGLTAPSELANVFELRKQVARDVISSHGEAGRFFVSFLDNHDQHNRFRYTDPEDARRYDDQAKLGIACLFTLQGIPCLYYGTEQGLAGRGDTDGAVREALWGKANAFDPTDDFYAAIQAIARVREEQPTLRYGRQYFRPVSGDRQSFGISPFAPGVLAFSRILNDQELVVVGNSDTRTAMTVAVIVDSALNKPGVVYRVLYSNKGSAVPPGAVEKIEGATVHEVDGNISTGTLHALPVTLAPCELQILSR